MNNIEWGKVEKDAKLLVRNSENEEWVKRHYAGRVENGYIYCYFAGMSSYTNDENEYGWRFAKLYEEQKGGKNNK